ncbi:MAG: hypothetical protein B7Z37_28065 [Verrucomicrobia bacterium 12-59-8]|nr:MAG: hypothetical protein B7Z37_28065 [Verrucomicrobia bacterium 12-59-8]
MCYFRGKRILLWTRKPGLGDMVMNAICCDILRREHGLDVWFGCRYNPYDRDFPEILKGIPCYKYQPDLRTHPLPNQAEPRGYAGGKDYAGQKHPFDFILDFRYHMHLEVNTLFQCLEEFGVSRMKVPCDGLPVHNLPGIGKTYDVVLSPDCGGWKPVRAYRRGVDLEVLLNKRGISVLNLSRSASHAKLRLPEVLAHVKAAKLFIGVETGPTHLVSGVHQQALVLQSGIHRSAFWNIYARTHVVEKEWACGGRKCQVRKHDECVIPEGVCMDRYAPEDIAELACELISNK